MILPYKPRFQHIFFSRASFSSHWLFGSLVFIIMAFQEPRFYSHCPRASFSSHWFFRSGITVTPLEMIMMVLWMKKPRTLAICTPALEHTTVLSHQHLFLERPFTTGHITLIYTIYRIVANYCMILGANYQFLTCSFTAMTGKH